MDQSSLESTLADLHLPTVCFFPTIDSTNDEAWRWVDRYAPHHALVVADIQTAGRGRLQRPWYTTSGSSLAFSLVLLSPPLDQQFIHRLTGLGALAVCSVLQNKYALPAQIKWPNDVLLDQCKTAGVLVEARWNGNILKAAIIGIGINIALGSVNPMNLPVDKLNFPATCIEKALGYPVDRLELLHAVLTELFSWLPRLPSHEFIQQWESNLAYRNQWVGICTDSGSPHALQEGKVIGLGQDGSLRLFARSGKLVNMQVGEIHLIPPETG